MSQPLDHTPKGALIPIACTRPADENPGHWCMWRP